MKKLPSIISLCLFSYLACASLALADAGYGRGPETDPVAMPIISGLQTSVLNLQTSISAAPGLTPSSTTSLVNTVAIQAKSLAGDDLAGYRVLRIWVSDSAYGAPSTNNIAALALSNGTAVATVRTNADYWYCSGPDGSAVAVVTAAAAGTNYIMCADGSAVSSAELVFTTGE